MANTVIALKKSATPSASPGSLANGELAINYADGIIFYKAANGVIASISSGTPSFGTISANGTLLIADQVNDYLTINPGDNITITGDAVNDKLTINANLTAANSWANTKLSNGTVTLDGALTTTGQIFANQQITIYPLSGLEGGQIDILGSESYPDWSIDSYGNALRFFTLNSGIQQVTFFNAAGGSVRMGVGTGNPQYTVDVSGDVNITGTYYVNGIPIAGSSMDYAYVNASTASANAWTNTVTTAGNNYTVSVGAASNNWANSLATAGNNYTISVGAAANNWANTKLSNTDNVVFNGSLQIANTLYAKDLVISNTMIANISGNINTLYIQNDITHVNSIFFATNSITSANGSVVAGQLTWNPDDLTLDLGTGSSIQQIGQEQYVKILNQSGETIYNSNAVSYYGTVGNSGRLLGRRAIANNSYDSKQILGIATQDIVNGAEGLVTTFGKVRKINTSMFSEGDILYVSPSIPGALQNTKPSAPNNKVQIGTVITKSATVGMIFAAVQRGSSLADDELAHFNGSLVNGDLIRYVSANGRFENVNENSTGPAINAVAAFAQANAARVNVGSVPPTGNTQGSLWWNRDYGRLFIYYTDTDSSQWVDVSPAGHTTQVADDFTSNTNTDFYVTFTANTNGALNTAYISSGKLTFNSNTGILSATQFNSLSDINKKTNVQTIDHAIDKVEKLDGVTFNWKDSGQPSAGLIAQQLKEVMPELVDDEMRVNYSGVIGLLIECIKELNKRTK